MESNSPCPYSSSFSSMILGNHSFHRWVIFMISPVLVIMEVGSSPGNWVHCLNLRLSLCHLHFSAEVGWGLSEPLFSWWRVSSIEREDYALGLWWPDHPTLVRSWMVGGGAALMAKGTGSRVDVKIQLSACSRVISSYLGVNWGWGWWSRCGPHSPPPSRSRRRHPKWNCRSDVETGSKI